MDLDPLDLTTVSAALAARGVSPAGRLSVVARTGSTSTDLRALAVGPEAWPDGSVLVTDNQVDGRGRAGRSWVTPPGSALTFSVLLRPGVPVERLGWVPLIGGLAVVQALSGLGLAPVLKWPNDVLLPAVTAVPGWGAYRKVAGLLGDLVVEGEPAVVLGIGVNVHQAADELPVPSATSVRLAGLRLGRAELLAAVLDRLFVLMDQWRADGGVATGAIAESCAAACMTIGRTVRVAAPGGEVVEGLAVGLAEDGALLVDSAGRRRAVLAGDVTLRDADGSPAV